MTCNYDYRLASLRKLNGIESKATSQPFHSESFRLLKLLPGSTDSELACNLFVRRLRRSKTDSFKEAEPYDALSYTWGPQHDSKCTIKIVADDSIYSLPIGKNLDAALRQLRSEEKPRHLWADAICINQTDKEEKSVQIPLMRDIYNDASYVRIWLGIEEKESNKAMEFMAQCTDTELFDSQIKDPDARPLLDAVSALMRRPWFNRRWIIQEVALARKAVVHCGTRSLDWRMFASVIGMLADAQPELKTLFRESSFHKNHPDHLGDLNELGAIKLAHLADNILLKDTYGRIDGRSLSLEALVASLTAFEASEPHDVIYAILWLADDAHPVTKHAFNVDVDPNCTSRRPSAWSLAVDSPQLLGKSSIPSPAFSLQDPSGTNVSSAFLSNGQGPTQPDQQARPIENGIGLTASPNRDHSEASVPLLKPAASGLQITVTPTGAGDTAIVNTDQVRSMHLLPSPIRQRFGRLRSPSIGGISVEQEKTQAVAAMFLSKLEQSRIVVDYELSAFEVYKNFLGLALRQSSSLDILCIPWAPNDTELPSWIPQLSKTAFGYTDRGILRRKHADALVKRPGHSNGGSKPYRAARSLQANYHFGGPDGRSLTVEGFILDRIHQLKKEAVDAVIPSEWMEAVGWTDQTKVPPSIFWRTLVGDLNTAGDAFAPINWEISCRDAFKRRTNGGHLNTSDILHDCPTNVRKFLERVQRVIWCRRLALLERHSQTSIALAPAEALEGDLICILRGCSVPVVLREVVEQQPTHSKDTLICYNCHAHGHHIKQCRNSLGSNKIKSNATSHQSNENANRGIVLPPTPPAPRISTKRRNSWSSPITTSPPCKKPRKYYKLIGECYVHRMMNGEATRRLSAEELKARPANALKQDSIFWRSHNKTVMFELR